MNRRKLPVGIQFDILEKIDIPGLMGDLQTQVRVAGDSSTCCEEVVLRSILGTRYVVKAVSRLPEGAVFRTAPIRDVLDANRTQWTTVQGTTTASHSWHRTPARIDLSSQLRIGAQLQVELEVSGEMPYSTPLRTTQPSLVSLG